MAKGQLRSNKEVKKPKKEKAKAPVVVASTPISRISAYQEKGKGGRG